MKDKEYFIATIDLDGKYLIYTSERYKMSEMDLLNLIKICIIERRNKEVGKKILDIYEDSNSHRSEITNERLKKLGIKNGNKQPDTIKNVKSK